MEPPKRVDVLTLVEKPDEHAATMARLEKDWPRQLELDKYIAKSLRAKFLALKAEGFDDKQALH